MDFKATTEKKACWKTPVLHVADVKPAALKAGGNENNGNGNGPAS